MKISEAQVYLYGKKGRALSKAIERAISNQQFRERATAIGLDPDSIQYQNSKDYTDAIADAMDLPRPSVLLENPGQADTSVRNRDADNYVMAGTLTGTKTRNKLRPAAVDVPGQLEEHLLEKIARLEEKHNFYVAETESRIQKLGADNKRLETAIDKTKVSRIAQQLGTDRITVSLIIVLLLTEMICFAVTPIFHFDLSGSVAILIGLGLSVIGLAVGFSAVSSYAKITNKDTRLNLKVSFAIWQLLLVGFVSSFWWPGAIAMIDIGVVVAMFANISSIHPED